MLFSSIIVFGITANTWASDYIIKQIKKEKIAIERKKTEEEE